MIYSLDLGCPNPRPSMQFAFNFLPFYCTIIIIIIINSLDFVVIIFYSGVCVQLKLYHMYHQILKKILANKPLHSTH